MGVVALLVFVASACTRADSVGAVDAVTAAAPTSVSVPTSAPIPTRAPEPTPVPTPTALVLATVAPAPTAEPPVEATAEPTLAPEPTAVPAAPAPTTAPAVTQPNAVLVANGGEVYTLNCARCHGENGFGSDRYGGLIGVGSAYSTSGMIAELTTGHRITFGFADRLSAEEIASVVAYVRASFP